MTYQIKFLFILLLHLSFINVVHAGDSDWLKKLAVEAKIDETGIKTKLAARFKLGDVKVDTVLSNVNNVEDAYMVMRLGEMSGKDTDDVLEEYQANKGKGWGVLAKRLGIKQGSREFHNLKRAHARHMDNDENNDMHEQNESREKGQGRNKGKGQGQGKNKGNSKGKGRY